MFLCQIILLYLQRCSFSKRIRFNLIWIEYCYCYRFDLFLISIDMHVRIWNADLIMWYKTVHCHLGRFDWASFWRSNTLELPYTNWHLQNLVLFWSWKNEMPSRVHIMEKILEKLSIFIKVSKSQRHFFFKLHCPKNEFCQIFYSFSGQWSLKKNAFEIYWPLQN